MRLDADTWLTGISAPLLTSTSPLILSPAIQPILQSPYAHIMSSAETQTATNGPDDSGLTDSMNRLNVGADDAPAKTEEEYAQSQLTLRAIVSSKEAGVIIGKAGKNVADLREETGVKAGVSKVVQGVHDRVLTVTGALSGISKAYAIVAKGLLEGAPQMGMGGVITNNGTHRKSYPVSRSSHANQGSSYSTFDLAQPNGYHHWTPGTQDQGNSGSLRSSYGGAKGNVTSIDRKNR